MSWSPEALAGASDDELAGFAAQTAPNLRQMHAIRELASRGLARPELTPLAAAAVAHHLGPRWRIGGLPVGYLGAQVLYDGPCEARAALSAAVAVCPPEERDDLMRWLSPAARPPVAPIGPVARERELWIHDPRSTEAIVAAATTVAGEPAIADALPLTGAPAAVALVTLSVDGWRRLERDGAKLSSALGTTVYWPAPAELGGLDPDLRLAIHPDGSRSLVRGVPIDGGYAIAPYG